MLLSVPAPRFNCPTTSSKVSIDPRDSIILVYVKSSMSISSLLLRCIHSSSHPLINHYRSILCILPLPSFPISDILSCITRRWRGISCCSRNCSCRAHVPHPRGSRRNARPLLRPATNPGVWNILASILWARLRGSRLP